MYVLDVFRINVVHVYVFTYCSIVIMVYLIIIIATSKVIIWDTTTTQSYLSYLAINYTYYSLFMKPDRPDLYILDSHTHILTQTLAQLSSLNYLSTLTT